MIRFVYMLLVSILACSAQGTHGGKSIAEPVAAEPVVLPSDTLAVTSAGVDPVGSGGHFQGLSPVSVTPLTSTNSVVGAAVGPTITYTCDSSINAVPGVCAKLNSTIAQLYTGRFNDVNANIYVTFGTTGLGQSLYVLNIKSYSSFRTALQSDQTDLNDVIAFGASVLVTNPINANYQVYLTNANARALSFTATTGIQSDRSTFCTIGTAGCYDGLITISSAQQSAGHLYFRSGPAITGSQYDFFSVVEHETDEILGTASCAFSACTHIYPADLYRYQSNGTRSFAAGNNNSCASTNSGNACFSIDGVQMLQQYNNLNNGSDAGDWATNCGHPLVQNAAGCPGVGGLDISPAAEIEVLNVIGYNLRTSSKLGIFRPSAFMMVAQDVNGNMAWDSSIDRVAFFGTTGDTMIYGDWDGSGTTKVGIFRASAGMFALDVNGNGAWDPGIDTYGFFGQNGDVPIVGDWTGDGKTKIGIYRPGTAMFALDTNNNLAWDAGIDQSGTYGQPGDTPVVGNWTGDGKFKVGIFRNGFWALDTNNNLTLDAGDGTGSIGQAGDTPLLGDWNGDGRTKVGIYRANAGMFGLDYNGNLMWDAGTDRAGVFGASASNPVVGDWDGTGTTRVGVFINGIWALDVNGNLAWDAATDAWGGFGASGDTPVVGKW